MMAPSRGTECNQTPNAMVSMLRSQRVGDNVHTRKEKSPRSPIKVPKFVLSGKGCRVVKQLGGWLRSSHPLKSA